MKCSFAINLFALVTLPWCLCRESLLIASDHWDSPSSRRDQSGDLTDIYAFPIAKANTTETDRLILIMCLHPYATSSRVLKIGGGQVSQPIPFSLGNGEVKQPGTLFSNAIKYRFHIRRARVDGSGSATRVSVAPDSGIQILCTFDNPTPAPMAVANGGALDTPQTMKCVVTKSTTTVQRVRRRFRWGTVQRYVTERELLSTSTLVDDESGGKNESLLVFAGCRADPSFIDANRSKEGNRGRAQSAKEVFTTPESLPVVHGNVLSIVVSIDMQTIALKRDAYPLLAVDAETKTATHSIDRMGRILMTSFLIGQQENVFATADLDPVKDAWNSDDGFSLNPKNLSSYKSALEQGLLRIDQLDGEQSDWDYNPHPFLNVLLGDFLLVDTRHPVAANSNDPTYMEIERSHFAGKHHTTCGGRVPNDDVVDTWLTWFVNGPNRLEPKRGDGVSRAAKEATNMFPFLATPHLPQ